VFSESAFLYDLVYEGAGKDYDAEAGHVLELVRQRVPGARTLLDVACGTGQHIARFTGPLECTGVDLDPDLLAIAAGRCPGATFHRDDMRGLDLGRQFDVVTCLHASVVYMLTLPDLRTALAAMARHVSPGGLLLVEMGDGPREWRTDLIGTVVARRSGVTAVRMGTSVRRGRVATVELQYLVGSDADGITHLTEHHDLGLFTEDEYLSALRSTGLAAEVLPPGPSSRRLLVGTATGTPGRSAAAGGREATA
jgi:SAM-dependent methyltransferase